MDSIIEISRLVGFEYPNEIIKTLMMKGATCDKDIDDVLRSPVLPPLSYTDDCMRFITLLRYWRGKEIAKECAKAYRKVKNSRETDEFWWSVQELLYRAKAEKEVIRRYLRRFRKSKNKIDRWRKRLAEKISVWILPPYIELLAGILPPRMAFRIVRRALKVLASKSDHFSRLGVSTFDLAYDLFERIYSLSLCNEPPKIVEENVMKFLDFYIGIVELSLMSGKDSVDPSFNFALWKDAD